MKIAFVASTLRRTGPVSQLLNMVTGLAEKGVTVAVFTLSSEPADSRIEDFQKKGIKVTCLGLGHGLYSLSATNLLRTALSKFSPNVVHSQGLRADLIIAGLKDFLRVTTIRTIFNDEYLITYGAIYGRLIKWLHTRAVKKFQVVAAVSAAVAEPLKNLGVKNVRVVRNGVDSTVYHPATQNERELHRTHLGISSEKVLFVYTGHISKRKDAVFLIQAFLEAKKKHPMLKLVLVGAGELMEQAEMAVGEDPDIKLAGRVSDVYPYLAAADYFVSASLGEGYPNAVLEAISVGLPCLLSNIGPHLEILSQASIGYSFTPGSQESFCLGMDELLTSDKESLKKNCVEVLGPRIEFRSNSLSYLEIYHELCA